MQVHTDFGINWTKIWTRSFRPSLACEKENIWRKKHCFQI